MKIFLRTGLLLLKSLILVTIIRNRFLFIFAYLFFFVDKKNNCALCQNYGSLCLPREPTLKSVQEVPVSEAFTHWLPNLQRSWDRGPRSRVRKLVSHMPARSRIFICMPIISCYNTDKTTILIVTVCFSIMTLFSRS